MYNARFSFASCLSFDESLYASDICEGSGAKFVLTHSVSWAIVFVLGRSGARYAFNKLYQYVSAPLQLKNNATFASSLGSPAVADLTAS